MLRSQVKKNRWTLDIGDLSYIAHGPDRPFAVAVPPGCDPARPWKARDDGPYAFRRADLTWARLTVWANCATFMQV